MDIVGWIECWGKGRQKETCQEAISIVQVMDIGASGMEEREQTEEI